MADQAWNQQGIVYQIDLGDATPDIIKYIDRFNPDAVGASSRLGLNSPGKSSLRTWIVRPRGLGHHNRTGIRNDPDESAREFGLLHPAPIDMSLLRAITPLAVSPTLAISSDPKAISSHPSGRSGGVGYQFFENPTAHEQLTWTAGLSSAWKSLAFRCALLGSEWQ